MMQAHIYNDLVRCYNRYRRKLQWLALEGRNFRKQDILRRRILRLSKTLTGMQRSLKLGMATAMLTAGILLFQPNAAHAQIVIAFDGNVTNPFGLLDIGSYSAPAFADLDGDGDMDMLAGESSGSFIYFQNVGTAVAASFAAAQTNPFGLTNIGSYSAPAFVDLDGDGDMDMMAGEHKNSFHYFQNIGTAAAPAFAEPQTDPFGLTDIGDYYNSTLAFADLDGDGDIDMMAEFTSGFGPGSFHYWENTGTAVAPAFGAAQTNPFGLTNIGNAPAFADLDGDGVIDMMAGDFSGNFFYFQNTGTAAAPAFADAQTNPFGLMDIGSSPTPALADLDGDGDMDMMAGEYNGNFHYFENTITCNGLTVYADTDDDTYGDAANTYFSEDCILPDGYVYNSTDCDDNNATINPGATEVINGVDDNCDGIVDADFWTQKADFGGTARWGAIGFSIDTKGYIGTGSDAGGFKNDFWEYDPSTNSWAQKANFGGGVRFLAVGFSIDAKGYIGTGLDGIGGTLKKDFWQYDPDNNVWKQKADFGGTPRNAAVAFSLDGKGYIGTGNDGTLKKDFWEYDPFVDNWTQKANFGGAERYFATGFSIGTKGYIGTGTDAGNFKKDFWEYDPVSNSWTQKAELGGTARWGSVGFSLTNKGYIGIGVDAGGLKNDFWEYDPVINTWTQKTNFEGGGRQGTVALSINEKGYVGTGIVNGSSKNDFWEYTPDGGEPICNIPTSLLTLNITSTTAKLKWQNVIGALSYKVRYKIAGTSEWTTTKALNNSKTLHGLTASTEYTWQVKSFCDIKPVVASDWSEKQFFTTDELRLSDGTIHEVILEIYPNPVSVSATISFSLNKESQVVVEIIDLNGRSLRVITHTDFSAGNHEVTFNCESLVAGIYFLQLKTNEGLMMKKLIIE